MSNTLIIRDGDPWWLSPDIWVVPGQDPNGVPGTPIAGRNNFVWGRVRNQGRDFVQNAKVNFYWTNPSTGILRSNSTLIGSAFVNLNPGEIKDVLCLVPWTPVYINEGHECLIAEIIHESDPLPTPLPDEFSPPDYNQIAQRNIEVIQLLNLTLKLLSITVSSPDRTEKDVIIVAESIPLSEKLAKNFLPQLGLKDEIAFSDDLVQFGISLNNDFKSAEEAIERKSSKVKLTVPAKESRAVYLSVKGSKKRRKKSEPILYQHIQVTERVGREIVGGISFLIIQNPK